MACSLPIEPPMAEHQNNTSKHSSSGAQKLLDFLAKRNLITTEAAEAGREALKTTSPGAAFPLDRLMEGLQIDEEYLASTLAEVLGIPYVNLAAFPPDPSVSAIVTEDLAARYRMIPLGMEGEVLLVAAVNPLDREAARGIEFATGRRVRIQVTTLTALRDAVDHVYHLEEALSAYLDTVPTEADSIAEIVEDSTDVETLKEGTQLPPIVKLLNLVLVEGIRTRASDIHIETTPAKVQVRYRIDGVMQQSFSLPKWVQDPLIARSKILANLDITERRIPQDGRIRIRYRNSAIDLRLSTLPTQYGEKVCMRVLDPSAGPKNLASVGLPASQLDLVRKAVTRPQGMVLVTGPTGSGKTTTLYGMIGEVASPKRNTITIENPIEYQMRNVNQVEINEKQGLSFAATLRSVLRQDPDVILIGEIRDSETAEVAVRAAQTGHLVFSTLHTNDSVAAITRLLDLGIDPFLVASSVHLVVAQRLVRGICQRCVGPYRPDPVALAALRLQESGNGYARGKGCPNCRELGYAGRAGIFEMLSITPVLAKLIETKASESELRAQAREEGMVLLAEGAAEKVRSGFTTVEEIVRVVDVSEQDAHCPSCGETVDESFYVCPKCRTQLRQQCKGCGKVMRKDWHACPYCAVPLPAVQSEAQDSHAAAPPSASAASAPEAPVTCSSSAAGALETPVMPPPASTRRYRVLVADDQRDFLFLIKIALERSDLPLDVEQATNGKEALEQAQSNPPDLLILDIMMPEMDGFEVCRRLRANVHTTFIPILMLTALDRPADRTKGFLAGTDDYLVKPVDHQELLARIRRILQRTYGHTTEPFAVKAA